MSLYAIEIILLSIDRNLRQLLHKFFPIPNQLSVSIQGESPMGAPISKTVGETVHFVATEFDTTTTPPTPFPIIPANQVWTQDVTTSGTLVVNPDGSADLTGTVAGVVNVTDTDTASNPGTTLTDTVQVTFTAPVVVPNQLVVTAS
jgi:hypothetical protein